MVKTFHARSESSSSYESVEDVEFKQLTGDQAEVEYLYNTVQASKPMSTGILHMIRLSILFSLNVINGTLFNN